ncbi:MAG: DUF5668 domain-containing protein [Anaerolineales bacterium]|jgi:hypothetical protein
MNSHRHRGVAGPLILIAIGTAFLLTNMGIMSWTAWGLFRLWPLILVAIGIDLLVGRRSTGGAILAAILIAAVLAGGLWLASTGYQAPIGSATESVQQPLEGATQGQFVLKPAVGSLHVSALAGSSPDLVTGSVRGQQPNDVRSQFSLNGSTGTFQMETAGTAVFMPTFGGGPTWDLLLNPSVPLNLTVEQGAGEMSLDLSSMKVSELVVNLGIGQITVRLPAHGKYTARVDGAIGDTTVIIPSGTAARITMNAALAGRSVPEGLTHTGNQYESADYATSSDSVDLVIGQAIGNVSVRRAAP